MNADHHDTSTRAEQLREMATQELARIDEDREILRLIEAGLTDDQIMTQLGVEHRDVLSIRQDHEQGETTWPVTPFELGLRRYMGQITTEEMMEQLRTWPYTFGIVHDDFYENKSWDDVERLELTGFITDDEYDELREIAEQFPDFPS